MNLLEFGKMALSALPFLIKGTLTTLQISCLSLLIGLSLGTCLGVLSSNKTKLGWLKPYIKGYVALIRGTPVFVHLLIAYFGLPVLLQLDLAPKTAGIIALGLNSAAYTAEIVRTGMNAIAIGQWEAASTLGYSPFQNLSSIILPQALRKMAPALTNELISLIKESSLLMILGVQELTKTSKDIVARDLNPIEIYLMTALIYFCLTTLVSRMSKKYEGGRE